MSDDAFHTTQWTQVLSARGSSEPARQALADLAERYYAPVVAFLQREGRKPDTARDVAHGFFAWLLARTPLDELERGRGRFRSYLLGALKHYLSNERQKAAREKRGGDITHLAIDAGTDTSPGLDPADPFALAPDREFDRQWALHILGEAMVALEDKWKQKGKDDEFSQLRPFLDGNPEHGALSKLAESTAQKEATLRGNLHRLRRAFRTQVKAQIAPTLDGAGEIDAEMSELVAALGSG
jgi:RNA polymerase sigma-70 factor (ECF subfamily)